MVSSDTSDLIGRAPGGRKLIAVAYFDMIGYSRLIGVDDGGTLSRLKALRHELIDPTVDEYGGRIVQTAGDSLLVVFDSIDGAVRCAVKVQEQVPAHDGDQAPDNVIRFRVGINISDVIVDGTDLHGDGVNVAVRLQAECPPGAICVSRAVRDHVHDRLGLDFKQMGALNLKNIVRPIEAFVLGPSASATTPSPVERPLLQKMTEALPLPDRPSIAVLPFRTHAAAEDGYFADGMVDEIIHALAGLRQLFVISRASTLGYSGRDIDIRALGRELGVSYLLQGSVRRMGNQLRITTELTDAQTVAIIHSDRFDGDISDLFALQDRIASQAVLQIAPHVQQAELRRTARKRPESMSAYDFVLQALDQLYRLDFTSFSRAHSLLHQAIREDAGYAQAYSYLSYWHILRVGQGWSLDSEVDGHDAERWAASAIDLDRNDALGLSICGHVHAYLRHDFRNAVGYLDRALEAGPNSAIAWSTSSLTSAYLGDGAAAVARAERGLRLSPRDPYVFWHLGAMAIAHYVNGDLESAVKWAEQARQQNPVFTSNHRILAASLAGLGRVAEAHVASKEALEIDTDFRLSKHMSRAPWRGIIRETLCERLRLAGFPD